MGHDTQNLVGGILIIVSLVGILWWQYINGVSTGFWPFRWSWQWLFFWQPAAYRELDTRSFWLKIIFSIVRILFLAAIILAVILGYLR